MTAAGLDKKHTQMHRTDKYSQHNSIIWQLSGSGFELGCTYNQKLFRSVLSNEQWSPERSKRKFSIKI